MCNKTELKDFNELTEGQVKKILCVLSINALCELGLISV